MSSAYVTAAPSSPSSPSLAPAPPPHSGTRPSGGCKSAACCPQQATAGAAEDTEMAQRSRSLRGRERGGVVACACTHVHPHTPHVSAPKRPQPHAQCCDLHVDRRRARPPGAAAAPHAPRLAPALDAAHRAKAAGAAAVHCRDLHKAATAATAATAAVCIYKHLPPRRPGDGAPAGDAAARINCAGARLGCEGDLYPGVPRGRVRNARKVAAPAGDAPLLSEAPLAQATAGALSAGDLHDASREGGRRSRLSKVGAARASDAARGRQRAQDASADAHLRVAEALQWRADASPGAAPPTQNGAVACTHRTRI